MALAAGTPLGPYEILAPLGAGGMGEVYRARDARLGREVAIKVLPEEVALDPERLRRFEQEARAASALNHPNILTVFDVGSRENAPYLVTELLEGASLREVLRRERLPLVRAVDNALQIARGMAAAHDKGIVHRDLKPENLFVTKDGRVKILDFGLARLTSRHEGWEGLSQAPTETKLSLTQEGAVVGTVGYMAPEQVRGEAADARSDVFAFGAVLYEMLSGRRAFARETAAETMTAILHEEPAPLSDLRPEVPAPVVRLLEHCLAKRREERFGSGREVLFALEVAGTAPATPGVAVSPLRARSVWRWLVPGVAGAAVAAVALLALLPRNEGPVRRNPVVTSVILPKETGSLHVVGGAPDVVLSPDGTRLAYGGIGRDRRPALWIRDLDSASVRELPGTVNGLGPFWSPDGRFVGFFAEDKLKKVPVDGGPAQVVSEAPQYEGLSGATWSREGVILFSSGGSLVRVPAAGGAPRVALERHPTEELFLRFPSFVPDGRRFLYFARRAKGPSGVYVGSLDGSEPPKLVHEGHSRAVFSTTGHLLFVRDGVLLAQPFDDRTLRPRGDPKPIATRVANHPGSGRAGFSVSERGRMAYTETAGIATELVWRDREGRVVEKLAEEGHFIGAVLAPDGRRVAVEIEDEETSQHGVFILGPARGVRSRLTRPPHDGHHPAWSPDGLQIAFDSSRTGRWLVYRQRTDGLGEDVLLHDRPDVLQFLARQWTPDGRAVLSTALERDGRMRLWLLPLSEGEKARPLVEGQQGALSADGRWLAVALRQAGRHQIYVLPFPALDTRWQVSVEGGLWPRWRSDGRELFYVSEDRKLISVRVTAGDGFEASPPQPLFPLPLRAGYASPDAPAEYDIEAGGQRFVICQVPEQVASPSITVVTDWEGLIRER